MYFFKILIQLYLLRSFLYYLTYYIKEVINGKIIWRLNKKYWPVRQLRLEQGNPLKIFKTLIQLYLFYFFLYFLLTLSKRVSKAIFLDIKLKGVGLRGSYGLKQGNPLQNINISNQIIFCSTKWIKKVIRGEIF